MIDVELINKLEQEIADKDARIVELARFAARAESRVKELEKDFIDKCDTAQVWFEKCKKAESQVLAQALEIKALRYAALHRDSCGEKGLGTCGRCIDSIRFIEKPSPSVALAEAFEALALAAETPGKTEKIHEALAAIKRAREGK